jgi:hypothetical protein
MTLEGKQQVTEQNKKTVVVFRSPIAGKIVSLRILTVVSSLILFLTGVVLFNLSVPLVVQSIHISETVQIYNDYHNTPILPIGILLFSSGAILFAFKSKRSLPILSSACVGMVITLSLWWLTNDGGFVTVGVYGGPMGWLLYDSGHNGGGLIGIIILNFLVNVFFWSSIVGTLFMVSRSEGLLLCSVILGSLGLSISVLAFFTSLFQMIGMVDVFHGLQNVLYGLASMTSSFQLLKWVTPLYPYGSPLLLLIPMVFLIIGDIGTYFIYIAWKKSQKGQLAYRTGITGGILMFAGSVLLFGFVAGILAILGAVESKYSNETSGTKQASIEI